MAVINRKVEKAFIKDKMKIKQRVYIFLVNGIKLEGYIQDENDIVIILNGRLSKQLIYKKSIATIIPSLGGDKDFTKY